MAIGFGPELWTAVSEVGIFIFCVILRHLRLAVFSERGFTGGLAGREVVQQSG